MEKIHKRWIYHATKEAKVIYANEFEQFQALGWAASPAAFIKLTDFNVDPDDQAQVQQFGESVEGVKNAINGALNIDKMSKTELVKYSKEFFDIDIDRKQSIKQLRSQVKKIAGA